MHLLSEADTESDLCQMDLKVALPRLIQDVGEEAPGNLRAGRHEGRFVSPRAATARPGLRRPAGLGLPDDPGDQDLRQTLALILNEFQSDDLDTGLLLVQELQDAPQFRRNLVGHEDQAHATAPQPVRGLIPESVDALFRVGLLIRPDQVQDRLSQLVRASQPFHGGRPHPLQRPKLLPVGGLIEHLAHDLPADQGVA